jgi:trehalose/maltose hydrolase-like predicted phosphorylase
VSVAATRSLASPRLHSIRRIAALIGVLVALSIALAPAAHSAPTSNACPGNAGSGSGWALSTTTFNQHYTRHPYVGNGYLSQRVPPNGMGYVSTGEKTGWPLYTPRYDGAFVAGLYARVPTEADPSTARAVIAAIPTWSTLNVTAGSETYSPNTPAGQISNFNQTLYLACGLLRTSLTWTTSDGKATDLVYDVIADRKDPHVGAVRVTMVPHWNGDATVTDLIDGAGARRVVQTSGGLPNGDSTVDVNFAAQTTNTAGAVASTLSQPTGLQSTRKRTPPQSQNLTASDAVTFHAASGTSYQFVKYVGVDTALTSRSPESSAVSASQQAASKGWSQLFNEHAAAWQDLWKSDIAVSGRPDLQEWLRSNTYALLSSIRQGSDNSIAPTGLSSDNYAGLIFWDAEIWMYPSLLLMHPDVARAVLDLRYKTLPGARANALKYGYQGVFFPWNGAGTGDLDTECHSWNPPHCLTQIHLQGDIALAAWQYYLETGDRAWLRDRGWPLLKGIAEFWAGRVTANSDGSYSITNVAGPDEYSNGVTDGVFTNGVAATALRDATKAAHELGEQAPGQWTEIADKLRMPFDSTNQVFMQYDGYQGSTIKQADTVLLIYPLEWPMSKQVAANTLDYYAERTDLDGPAMTDAIHAVDAAQIGEPGCSTHTYLMRSILPFVRDPFAQFAEARGAKAGLLDPLAGSPAYNFLTGSGGFSQVFTYGLTGLRWRDNAVHLDPMLPPQLAGGVTLKGLHWRGRTFDIQLGGTNTTVTLRDGPAFPVEGPDETTRTVSGSLTLPTRRPDLTPTTNLARCHSATATAEEPGLYAEAAIDGSTATIWAPPAPSPPSTTSTADLTVDLGKRVQITSIVPHFTDARPTSYKILTSADGKRFTEVSPDASTGTLPSAVQARYVRVNFTRGTERAGVRELEVK